MNRVTAVLLAPVRVALVGAQRATAALSRMVFPAGAPRWFYLPGSNVNYRAKVGDGTGSSTVTAPLFFIARTLPEAPPALWKLELETGQEDRIYRHPLLDILQRPNEVYTGPILWMATAIDWHVDGNAYWLIVRSPSGAVKELWWAPSWTMTPQSDDDTKLVTHYDYSLSGREPLRLDPLDVVHFRFGLDPHDLRRGSSPLKSVLREVFTDDEAAAFTATILGNMGVPGVVVSPDTDEPIAPEDVDATKEYFKSAFGGDRRGEPLVMTGRTKVEQFGFSPEQLLLRELRRIPEERVTAVLGVPAIVAGLGAGLDRSTFTNYAEARSAAYESTLIPMQRILGEDIRFQLLPNFEADALGFRFGFDLSKVRVLQEDLTRQAQRHDLGVRGGWETVAEARRAAGLEVVEPRDDVFLRQSNIAQVDASTGAGGGTITPLFLNPADTGGNGNGSGAARAIHAALLELERGDDDDGGLNG